VQPDAGSRKVGPAAAPARGGPGAAPDPRSVGRLWEGWTVQPGAGLALGLAAGLGSGLVCGLVGGGSACLQHWVLRILLQWDGCAPFRYVRFLDSAAGQLLLRKVGGGYILTHRLLQDHFAGKWGASLQAVQFGLLDG
jgi:hypothetical protein